VGFVNRLKRISVCSLAPAGNHPPHMAAQRLGHGSSECILPTGGRDRPHGGKTILLASHLMSLPFWVTAFQPLRCITEPNGTVHSDIGGSWSAVVH
jgi:hypothetical protein